MWLSHICKSPSSTGWIELDVFGDYYGSFEDILCLYQKQFAPIAFDDTETPCYNSDDWARAVNHARGAKAETYWNEIIKRYEVGKNVESFGDNKSHWAYDGADLANEE